MYIVRVYLYSTQKLGLIVKLKTDDFYKCFFMSHILNNIQRTLSIYFLEPLSYHFFFFAQTSELIITKCFH